MPDQPLDIQKMLNALPAMVGYWDRDLRNRMANDAYVAFFGMTPAEMYGRHIREVLGEDLFAKNL
ncbi:MAG: PAS domain-containing protein, partial [Solirubrobacterales bacterium]